VRRIVDLSYVDADAAAANAYRRAKGQAEQVLAATGLEVLTLCAPRVFGPPADPGPRSLHLLARAGRPVTVIGRPARSRWRVRRS
jgi:uncharacterized protein YbjT (DUF2867 family)